MAEDKKNKKSTARYVVRPGYVVDTGKSQHGPGVELVDLPAKEIKRLLKAGVIEDRT